MTDALTFLLEEYKALRKEIEFYLAEARSLERYTLIACGVIWGWLIINRDSFWLLWLAPMLVTGAACFRSWALFKHFGTISRYIKGIEAAFNVKGWEHDFSAIDARQRRVLRGSRISVGFSNIVLSAVLFVLSFAGFLMRDTLTRSIPTKIFCR